MAETSWPFHDGTDGTPVLEDQWSYMARQWAATGVVGAPGDANLQVFANSSGREVHVRAGRACVRGHWYRLDAQTTLTIAANASGNPRIDRVVLRLDPSADEVTAEVLQGTPAASPSAPALTTTDTGTFEVLLAQVAVANGAASIGSGNVTDERTFTSVPYTPALSSRRPSNPVVGQGIYETDTGLDKVWNGSAWVARQSEGYYSTWTPAITGTGANPVGYTSTGRYTLTGKRCGGWGRISGFSSYAGAGAMRLSLPVTPASTSGSTRLGSCQLYNSGTNGLSHWQLELVSGTAQPIRQQHGYGEDFDLLTPYKYMTGSDLSVLVSGFVIEYAFDFEAA